MATEVKLDPVCTYPRRVSEILIRNSDFYFSQQDCGFLLFNLFCSVKTSKKRKRGTSLWIYLSNHFNIQDTRLIIIEYICHVSDLEHGFLYLKLRTKFED